MIGAAGNDVAHETYPTPPSVGRMPRLLLAASRRQDQLSAMISCFAMVPQDTWLFAGSIADNMACGNDGATDEEIVAADRAAYADHFVPTLPDSHRTLLDEDASNISSGQRQLLTTARAFLASPGISSPTRPSATWTPAPRSSSRRRWHACGGGRTSFVIAHRPSTIRNAGTIVVMNAGRIVEQGSHDDLLHRHGFYYELYNSQLTETMAETSAGHPEERLSLHSGAGQP